RGFSEQAQSVQGTQAELAYKQAQLQGAGAKVRDANRQWLMETVGNPAGAEYEEVLKSTGSVEQAHAAGQRVYTEGRTAALADGRLGPQDTPPPNFDYRRWRANSLTYKERLAEQRANAQETRANMGEARAERKDERETAEPKYVGSVDGKEVPL